MQKKKHITIGKMKQKAVSLVMNRILCSIFFIILGNLSCGTISAESIGVIGDDVNAYAGSGSSNDPLHYLFDAGSKVTWKHLCDVRDQGLTESYENREENTSEGKLCYSWTFSAENILSPEGPYFLGISFYNDDTLSDLPGGSEAFYFSFACKRDLPGKAVITLYVGDRFDNDTKLELYYYGGYDATVIHGTTPVIDRNEIFQTDNVKNIAKGLTVSDGYVSFVIRHGGNYYLTEKNPAQRISQVNKTKNSGDLKNEPNTENTKITNTDEKKTTESSMQGKDEGVTNYGISKPDGDHIKSNTKVNEDNTKDNSAKTSKASDHDMDEESRITDTQITENTETSTVYSEETILGKIEELFPTDSIARAVADSLTKNVGDEISQADLNGIKRLYLSGKGLKNIDELGNMNFERLESLELADNDIISLPVLHMPMLNHIDLSNNQLSEASKLNGLKELEVICLQNNQLTAVPDISRLPKLKSVDVSNNRITTLPVLKSNTLAYLNLSNNGIKEIGGLKYLPELEYIDISGNSIRRLPDFTICRRLGKVVAKQDTFTDKYRKLIVFIGLTVLSVLIFCLIFRVRKSIIHNKISS